MRKSLILLSLLISSSVCFADELANVVCFVRFADQTEEQWKNDRAFYETLYNDDSENANSVRAYYKAMSYGALDWKTTIAEGEFTSKRNRNYFRPNSATNNEGYAEMLSMFALSRLREIVKDAADQITAGLPEGTVVDCNNDGYVDNLTLVIMGESEKSSRNGILWPMNLDMLQADATIKGARVKNFLIIFDSANGFKLNHGLNPNTGVICHEMAHTLNVYDLYTSDASTAVGIWDVMSDNAVKAQGMTAYIRHTYGKDYGDWIPEVKTLTTGGTYTLNAINSSTPEDVAFKIVPDASRDEYFMIEYRKAEGWDQPLPSSGLLAYRVTPGVGGNLGSKRELYVLRGMDGLSKATLDGSAGRTSLGRENDMIRPEYSDGTVAPFSISDVVLNGDRLLFNLSMESSALTEIQSSDFRIECNGMNVRSSEEAVIEIYNIAGMKVMTAYGCDADITSLQPGIYIVTATTPTSSATLKIRR